MSIKERIVFLDRAGLGGDALPIPNFDHNWSEYPATEAADVVPRLFWATIAITHAVPLDIEVIGQLHKLRHVVVTGPATVDAAACKARGIAVRHLPANDASGPALICLLETAVSEADRTL
ncbi:MAG: hypothetical protein ACM3KD_02655 [Hyphomicrobiaceae bacterium]